jgi:hypothetical protein
VDKLYFGAFEQKGRSLTNELAEANLLNHKTEVTGGVLEKECSMLLTDFFSSMRRRAKAEKDREKEGGKEEEVSSQEKIPENNFDKSGGNG